MKNLIRIVMNRINIKIISYLVKIKVNLKIKKITMVKYKNK